MSYEVGDAEDGSAPFVLDGLHLSHDASLAHFFSSLSELIGHGQQETLLFSAIGATRDIDDRLLQEAKVPVHQTQPDTQPAEPGIDSTAAASSTASFAPPSSSAPLSSSSSSPAASLSSLNRDSRQAELIAARQLEAQQRKKREKKQNLKRWLGPLVRGGDNSSNSSSSASAASSSTTAAVSAAAATGTGASPLSSTRSTAAAAAVAASSSSAASGFPAPSPATLLITTLAVYVLPPAIAMELDGRLQHFLILNQYHRIALQDVLLVSLPYRSGISLTGGDYALRINDFILHLRSGKNVWLQSPAGRRSVVVEVLSDAYRALLGHSLQIDQPDYLQLVSALHDGSIVTAMKQMRMEWWAVHAPREQGWLVHRSLYERSPNVVSPTGNAVPVFEQEHDREGWSMRWFVLSRDNYLLQFTSPAELEAFRLVMSAADSSVQSSEGRMVSKKFPASFDCIEIDLTRAAVTMAAAAPAAGDEPQLSLNGFEVLVFPRGEASGTPVYDKGHTRHLFTVIPPFSEQMQAGWRQGDSPAQLLQELLLHYSRKPSVVIPTSSQADRIDPPSPASAQALQADDSSPSALGASASSLPPAAAASEADGSGGSSGASPPSLLPFYPPGHPLSALRFPPSLVASLRASTARWLASIDDAINFNQMGGTRSAEDSVGARAAVRGRHSRDGSRSPLTSPSSAYRVSTSRIEEGREKGRDGLFMPVVDLPLSPRARQDMDLKEQQDDHKQGEQSHSSSGR